MALTTKKKLEPDHEEEAGFDLYTCEGGHILVTEHRPSWGELRMIEAGCPFCKNVAEYRTTCTLLQLQQAIIKYVAERLKKP